MGTLDEVIAAVAKARTPKSRWLMVVFLAQFLEWGRSEGGAERCGASLGSTSSGANERAGEEV